MKRILIIEDDPAILTGLEATLKDEQYEVLTAMDGEKGYQLGKKENISLIILDIMLPKKSGMDVCRDLRKEGVAIPILMLTSKKEEVDEIMGFEVGANDYVTKPFSPQRLLARIRNLIRPGNVRDREIDNSSFHDVVLDFKKLEGKKNGLPLELSAKEFEILKYFIIHEGEVISRDALLDDVWGYESYPTTRTVDNYILSIRKKIETDPAHPRHLLTIHTVGYKFIKEP
jgi:DNA-binding response OmpR family regulator